jgi:hypothetical protein
MARFAIRPALESEVEEIARIINAAFEVEREFRRGERTSRVQRDEHQTVDQSGFQATHSHRAHGETAVA